MTDMRHESSNRPDIVASQHIDFISLCEKWLDPHFSQGRIFDWKEELAQKGVCEKLCQKGEGAIYFLSGLAGRLCKY